MSAWKATLANTLLFAASAPDTLGWALSTRDVASTQRRLLLSILRRNASTAFGRLHRFSTIDSVEDFQSQVPIAGHASLEPYIQRAARGESAVLTADPISSFALTSGSSAASKLIPYTSTLLEDFRHGIHPWLAGLFLQHPSLLAGPAYWQISPVSTMPASTPAGIPIGFGDDSEILGGRQARLVRAAMAVPGSVASIAAIPDFRRETLRHLLHCPDLRLISVWNPSFLTLLLERAQQDGPALLSTPRLQRIWDEWTGLPATRVNARGRTLFEALWPRLRVISCWSSAAAGSAAARLRLLFPNTAIQPKGCIATEAMITFPWRNAGNALSIRSHFFEFVEVSVEDPQPLLAHQLQPGRRYSVVLTTSGGLYRYRLGDILECRGRIHQCPLLEFIGRESSVVDLVGEKLNAAHVQDVVCSVLASLSLQPAFWMVAPQTTMPTPRYTLYIQLGNGVPLPHVLAADIETGLSQNFHYAYARRLGQLDPLDIYPIHPDADPETGFLEAQAATHAQRLGDIKRPVLHRGTHWSTVFPPDDQPRP